MLDERLVCYVLSVGSVRPRPLLRGLTMRPWLLFIFFRRLHSLLGCCRSLEHRNGQQPRDARCHLHHPADDAQSPAHGVEDGIAERGLTGLGLVFCHRPTHTLILAQSERGCESGTEAVTTLLLRGR